MYIYWRRYFFISEFTTPRTTSESTTVTDKTTDDVTGGSTKNSIGKEIYVSLFSHYKTIPHNSCPMNVSYSFLSIFAPLNVFFSKFSNHAFRGNRLSGMKQMYNGGELILTTANSFNRHDNR